MDKTKAEEADCLRAFCMRLDGSLNKGYAARHEHSAIEVVTRFQVATRALSWSFFGRAYLLFVAFGGLLLALPRIEAVLRQNALLGVAALGVMVLVCGYLTWYGKKHYQRMKLDHKGVVIEFNVLQRHAAYLGAIHKDTEMITETSIRKGLQQRADEVREAIERAQKEPEMHSDPGSTVTSLGDVLTSDLAKKHFHDLLSAAQAFGMRITAEEFPGTSAG